MQVWCLLFQFYLFAGLNSVYKQSDGLNCCWNGGCVWPMLVVVEVTVCCYTPHTLRI